MSLSNRDLYEFEGFLLDVADRRLERKGKRVELTDRAFDVLCVLVRNGGRLVTKDQLLNEVWPGTFVEENSINKNISLLRRSLSAGRTDVRFIETVRGRGFRFIARINIVPESGSLVTKSEKVTETIDSAQQAPAIAPYSSQGQEDVVALDWRDRSEDPQAADAVESPTPLGPTLGTPEQNPAPAWRLPAFALGALLLLFLLAAVIYFAPNSSPSGTASDRVRTVAVLPFRPLVPESRDEAFEMGMADTLISKLSSSRQMIIRPLSAVQRYSSLDVDQLAAGRALAVDAVLEGSIQRSNDTIRVNVRLINVSDGAALWTGTFDENFTDIFEVQDAISRKVASALEVRLNSDEQDRLAKRYTTSPQAYEFYLRGREHYFKITPPEMVKAIEFFQKAIEIDPTYALAYAGLADAYRTQAIAAHAPANEVCPRAKQFATRALELDETLAEGHIAMAWVQLLYDWNWRNAERSALRGIELAPNNSEAHRVYAHILSVVGRHDEAIAEGRLARELAPLTLITAALEGQFLYYAGRLGEAEERLQKTLEMDPNFWVALAALGRVYLLQGREDEAIAAMSKARETSGGSNEPLGQLGYVLAKTGRRTEAGAILQELRSARARNYVPMYYIALVHNGLGEKEMSLQSLENASLEREAQMAFIKVDVRWDWLRTEPRFQALMRQLNFE